MEQENKQPKRKKPSARLTDKHYDDMNRRERREYKRWLDKHNMWDGAIVIENLERNNRLDVRG